MHKSIGVMCVDDHPLIIAGVQAIVDSESEMTFLGGATTATDGLHLFRRCLPEIALIDLRLPDMPGAALISSIFEEFPRARLVALTTYKAMPIFRTRSPREHADIS
jgi:DNA-binding NarL/FixJ family response regulator